MVKLLPQDLDAQGYKVRALTFGYNSVPYGAKLAHKVDKLYKTLVIFKYMVIDSQQGITYLLVVYLIL